MPSRASETRVCNAVLRDEVLLFVSSRSPQLTTAVLRRGKPPRPVHLSPPRELAQLPCRCARSQPRRPRSAPRPALAAPPLRRSQGSAHALPAGVGAVASATGGAACLLFLYHDAFATGVRPARQSRRASARLSLRQSRTHGAEKAEFPYLCWPLHALQLRNLPARTALGVFSFSGIASLPPQPTASKRHGDGSESSNLLFFSIEETFRAAQLAVCV